MSLSGPWLAPVLSALAAIVIAAGLTPLAGRYATQLGLVSPPRPDRWGSRPTPLLGGFAIVTAVIAPVLVLAPLTLAFAAVVAGVVAAFALGLIDDVRGLRPTSKLVGQVAIASGLAIAGMRVEIVSAPPIAFLLTLLWVVGMMNAVNLVDNMDGLAAGVAAIAAVVLLIMAPIEPAWIRVVAAALTGACIGFLIHNFAPARIYMGDAGSQAIGFVLAALALALTHTAASTLGLAILGPLLVLGLPLFDTALVAVTRRVEGRPVSAGGRDHTSHRLAALGLGERMTVVILYVVAMGFALLGLLSSALDLAILPVIALVVIGLILFGIFLAQSPQLTDELTPRVQVLGAGHRLVRFGGEIALDVALATIALFSAYLIRFEALRPSDWMYLFIAAAPILIPLQLAAFVLLGVYRTLWRFLAVTDAVSIFRAVFVGTLVASLLVFFVLRQADQSRAVFLLDGVILTMLVIGSRAFALWLRHWSMLRARTGDRRVLIVGATDSGELVLQLLLRSKTLSYHPAGFLDDDPGKIRRRIRGVPVLGRTSDLAAVAKRERVDLVVVAVEDPATRASMREQCSLGSIEMREFGGLI